MKKLMSLVAVAGVLIHAGILYAEDGSFSEGSASMSARIADTDDAASRAAEFETRDQDGAASASLDWLAVDGDRSILIGAEVLNDRDLSGLLEFRSGSGLRNEFSFQRFIHRLDHDYLDNMVGRQSADPATNKPGGKMFTHDDTDPEAEYGVVITELKNEMEVALGEHLAGGWEYRHRTRMGIARR